MKTKFTKEYILSNKGCYSREQVEALSFINKKEIAINDFIDSEIPTRDRYWWLIIKCELTNKEYVQIAVDLAEIVLLIYENKYKSKAPRKAIELTKKWLNGDSISSATLLNAYNAASNAAYAAADDDAADAAYAAANAAAAAADYDDASNAYCAAAAAVAAAVAADNTNNKYIKQIEDYLNRFKI